MGWSERGDERAETERDLARPHAERVTLAANADADRLRRILGAYQRCAPVTAKMALQENLLRMAATDGDLRRRIAEALDDASAFEHPIESEPLLADVETVRLGDWAQAVEDAQKPLGEGRAAQGQRWSLIFASPREVATALSGRPAGDGDPGCNRDVVALLTACAAHLSAGGLEGRRALSTSSPDPTTGYAAMDLDVDAAMERLTGIPRLVFGWIEASGRVMACATRAFVARQAA